MNSGRINSGCKRIDHCVSLLQVRRIVTSPVRLCRSVLPVQLGLLALRHALFLRALLRVRSDIQPSSYSVSARTSQPSNLKFRYN